MKNKFSISAKAKNLFLLLTESITQTLNVTSYYVCRGTNMGDHWTWEKDDKWHHM
jgi:signal-transduction protein with cAMP-binding, CBS, and nucleotidyltransferase domain